MPDDREVSIDMKNTYILTPSGELYHYGVKGMKWGVRKASSSEYPIGQNYSGGGGGGEPEELDEELAENELLILLMKAAGYSEAAIRWLKSRTGDRISDLLSGNTSSMSWQEAKEWVDSKYEGKGYPKISD